jgi:hypothetical protein
MKSDRKNKSKSKSISLSKKKKLSSNKRHTRKGNKRHSKKVNKIHSRKSTKKQNGGECEYLKVHGMNIPDLKIPDQYGLLNESCQPASVTSNEGVLHGHPNMTT